MLSLILVLAVGQAPSPRGPVAVVISSKRPGADAYAAKVASRVHAALENQGVDSPLDNDAAVKKLKGLGYSDPRNCSAAVPCLARLAKLLGPRSIVVGVDVAKVAKTLALHLEAVGPGGESLASADVNGSADGWLTEMGSAIDGFAKQVADKVVPAAAQTPELKPVAKEQPTDKPVATNLEPPIPPPPPPPVAPEPEKKSRVLPFTLGGAAIVSLAVSGVFLGLGMSSKSSLDGSKVPGLPSTSSLTRQQVNDLASEGNTRFTVSLITVILGAVLAAGSAFLFVF